MDYKSILLNVWESTRESIDKTSIPNHLTHLTQLYGNQFSTGQTQHTACMCVQRHIASTNRFGAYTDYPIRRNLGCAETLCYACKLFL